MIEIYSTYRFQANTEPRDTLSPAQGEKIMKTDEGGFLPKDLKTDNPWCPACKLCNAVVAREQNGIMTPTCRGCGTTFQMIKTSCQWCKEFVYILVIQSDFDRYIADTKLLVQNVFPYLSKEEREMFISGTCPKCWDDMFKGSEL